MTDRSFLVRSSDLTGRPVVTLGGDQAHEVKDVVFDKSSGSLTGFTLRAPGLLGGPQNEALPVAGIRSVGSDAVMIESPAAFTAGDALAGSGDNVLGDRVITDAGTELGTVTDVILSVQRGEADLVGLEIDPAPALGERDGKVFLPLPDIVPMSDEAVVVPAGAADRVVDEPQELAAAVASLRNSQGEAS